MKKEQNKSIDIIGLFKCTIFLLGLPYILIARFLGFKNDLFLPIPENMKQKKSQNRCYKCGVLVSGLFAGSKNVVCRKCYERNTGFQDQDGEFMFYEEFVDKGDDN